MYKFSDLIATLLGRKTQKPLTSSDQVISLARCNIKVTDGCVVINGHSYIGNNIRVNGNDVYIDGQKVTQDTSNNQPIHISIEGNCDNLSLGQGQVEVHGNVEKLSVTSGDAKVNGNSDEVSSVSGDIVINGDCNTAKTVSGDISARTIRKK